MTTTITAETALRIRRLNRAGKPGKWHVVLHSGGWTQAWCGSQMRGISYKETDATLTSIEQAAAFGQVCPSCLTAVRKGQPKPYVHR